MQRFRILLNTSLLILISFSIALAQTDKKTFFCNYVNSEYNSELTKNYSETKFKEADASNLISWMLDPIGLKPNFVLFETSLVDNAAAIMFLNERVILVNPSFENRVKEKTNTDWALISILAHEIGHHLQGHTTLGSSSQKQELEADEFSGFLLNKLGASLQDATIAMKIFGSTTESTTHPNQTTRLLAIYNGWNNAAKNNKTSNQSLVEDKRVEGKSNKDLYLLGKNFLDVGRFHIADSIFMIYTKLYPNHTFGYYGRALANWRQDPEMKLGLANQFFQKLITIAEMDKENNKAQLKLAYRYFVGYHASITKDYSMAIEYCNNILNLFPNDPDATSLKESLKKERRRQ
ncbi:MAG: hypothetical protein EKK37_04735 [Sphingobacteriales bacterium]|nr:MAG: hypothetical protein EKK37_04735 [Sphingobacteriales bacterium]